MLSDINEIYIKNAKKNNIYSGKRFLGYTPNKKEVWVTMKYVRDTKELSLWVDTSFHLLYKKGAELAQSRLSIKANSKKIKDIMPFFKAKSINIKGAKR